MSISNFVKIREKRRVLKKQKWSYRDDCLNRKIRNAKKQFLLSGMKGMEESGRAEKLLKGWKCNFKKSFV